MKLGVRGQVTIPKEIRDTFGLAPDTEIEFEIINHYCPAKARGVVGN